MKKILLLVFVFCNVNFSNAQILISLLLGDKLNSDKLEFGLDGGLTLSKLEGTSSDLLRTFNIGFYFDIKFKNPAWMFNTGIQVKTNLGATEMDASNSINKYPVDSPFASGSLTRKLGYFNMPVLLKYNFKNHLYVQGGIQAGLKNKGVDEFIQSVHESNDTRHEHDIRSGMTLLDFGLSAGIGYRLMGGNGMNLGVRYYHGLIDVVKNNTGPAQFNRAVYINVGIPIGKTPKK